ncbi:Insulin-like growth factor 1 receptor [Pseudolycoriella hygida]|uniref:receptor protein-tyrosine kinase n=1 Tax=Pseudolycoriella hygida TaxID=35572 RepID=A0A9Q0NHM8_9DIPT|nr:Insulin-like growth factor 1 receptor [Pseudolycoriella hygida]
MNWFILLIVIALHDLDSVRGNDMFKYECLPKSGAHRQRFASPYQDPVLIQVGDNVLNQISSRIYAIYLKEYLGYNDLVLQEIDFKADMNEEEKLYNMFEDLWRSKAPALNLAIWMPPDYHRTPPEIRMAGPFASGRFGWFFPKILLKKGDLPDLYPYTIFAEPNTKYIRQFILDPETLNDIRTLADSRCPNCTKGIYIPKQCEKFQCATLLAPSYKDTHFVRHHIEEFKLYLNIVWLGDNLKPVIDYYLLPLYESRLKDTEISKKFLVLHAIPSEIINSNVEYEMITMPHCEEMMSYIHTNCKYELMPLLKYYTEELTYSSALYMSFLNLDFEDTGMRRVFELYDNATLRNFSGNKNVISKYPNQLKEIVSLNYKKIKYGVTSKLYNDIACEWIKQSKDIYEKWFDIHNDMEVIYIGGIFPITAAGAAYSGLLPAVDMAERAINSNSTILPNIKINVLKMDGKCRADEVMKSFISIYMRHDRVLGVLGPACSETVEPIAGVSKHFKMSVISYSAEGTSFRDRETYPYFFRTIGENQQYEYVYLQLMQHLKWKRVAALTEDGQKYTEYISHMETYLKEHGIELIWNKKFPRYVTAEEMNRNLKELQQRNARVIIADVYDERSEIIMCEAYKLKMTLKYGYVWFLPVWLSMKTGDAIKTVNTTCTEEEMLEAMNGHFSLQHAPYAEDNVIMQENISVAQWKKAYEQRRKDSRLNSANKYQSEYAGYAYDAVWVYAFALNQLVKEDASYMRNLHSENTTKRLMEVIKDTDFVGVSGRIRFGEGASRFSVINVLQWFDGRSTVVGTFHPNVSESHDMRDRKLIGGKLVLHESNISWLYDKGVPSDGTETCSIGGFADLIGLDCRNGVYVLVTFVCVICVIVVSIASFMFLKRQYDQKLKQSARVMRTFGIDLLSLPSAPSNSLDKWEVPKERVVINRRLGEGAFGTVYGGEAQINDQAWTAVAVKTLKMGSSVEDRLDFLSEAESMKRFDHKNIVKLLGVCLQSEPIYTIMEYMLHGDLKTYLLARRHLVGEKSNDDSDISPKRLTTMVLDISKALAYLADHKYVHRDVACRNCLVNAQRMVKLGDFGMARPMFDSDYYKFNRKGMLPVRWMAPESLGLGIFSPASDLRFPAVCKFNFLIISFSLDKKEEREKLISSTSINYFTDYQFITVNCNSVLNLSDCLSDPWTGLHLQILALESAEYRGQSHNSFVRTSFLDRTAAEIANDYYKFNRKGMLPVRWMAPESLGLGIFSPASDLRFPAVCKFNFLIISFTGLDKKEEREKLISSTSINYFTDYQFITVNCNSVLNLSDCLSDPWTGLHLQILALESAEYRGQSHNSFVRTSFLDRTAAEIAKIIDPL